ncbi:GIY-YIG nuclease family protein [Neoroseomonas rubea]|uniref:GIY-YIG nuclease family protein n=1 Tax=Neoroseomonas rubea TaxID=2748666 RepID=UPI0018E0397F|nr:GIY-YIG nuclease family protein [Roseomonas rubea]
MARQPSAAPDRAGVIYRITNMVNAKPYIGQTTKPGTPQEAAEARLAEHVRNAGRPNQSRRPCRALEAAIRKHGADAFRVEVLEVFQGDRADLNAAEQRWIVELGSMRPAGYNLREGGAASALAPESKARLSAASKAAQARPDVKERQIAGTKAAMARDGVKERKSEAATALWESEAYRALVSARHRGEDRKAAARGLIPDPPDFSKPTHALYRALLASVVAMVEARDMDALRAFSIHRWNSDSLRAIQRYRDNALLALEVQAAQAAQAAPMAALTLAP